MSFLWPKQPLHKYRWAAVLLLVGGLAMAIGGLWFVKESSRFLETAERTAGKVVAISEERGAKGLRKDHAIVRFSPPETGWEFTFKSKTGLWPSPFSVGDDVDVAYQPGDPEDAEIVSFWTLWFLPCLMAVFGLLCLGAGWHTLRSAKRS